MYLLQQQFKLPDGTLVWKDIQSFVAVKLINISNEVEFDKDGVYRLFDVAGEAWFLKVTEEGKIQHSYPFIIYKGKEE